MAITLIGQAGQAGAQLASPQTITYSSAAGSTLIIVAEFYNFSTSASTFPTTITDTAGNAWQFSTGNAQTPPTQQNNSGADGFTSFVAWCSPAKAITSVTLARQDTAATEWWRLAVTEWSGVGQFDNSWAGSAASGATFTLGPVQVNAAGSLVIGTAVSLSGGEGLPAGWTTFSSAGATNVTGYIIRQATGAYSPVWSGTSSMWASAVAVFTPQIPGAGAARPGRTWSRRFHHRQLVLPAAVAPVTDTAGAAALVTAAAAAGTVYSNSTPANITGAAAPVTAAGAAGNPFLPVGSPSGGPWVLSFADDFDVAYPGFGSQGAPNPAVWSDHMFWGDAARNNNATETQWYSHNKAGLSVAGSVLTLTARFEDPTNPASVGYDPACTSPMGNGATGSFTSGWASSQPGFRFTYGYVEGRMRIPSGGASWPSLWMFSMDGNWPPEIDVQEFIGTNHVGYWADGASTVTYDNSGAWADTNWHVWGMRWLPTGVTWFLDGAQIGSYPAGSISILPMHICLQHAVTGSSGTGHPDAVDFDYIRHWTVAGAPAQPVITTISPANGVPSAGQIVVSFAAVAGATSYRASYSQVDMLADGLAYPQTRHGPFTAASSPITITGLVNGARYCVSVAAVNATGYSIESAVVPSFAPPTPDIQGSAAAVGVTAGTGVTWPPQPAGTITGGPWQFTWGDEFSDPLGTGHPDTAVWADHMIGSDSWRANNSNEVEWYPHDHSGETITGGILSLTATSRGSADAVQLIDPMCPDVRPDGGISTYTSGMIQSHPGFQFTYGYVEARIQQPAGWPTGWWPAFWMVSADSAWPPEIDIDEENSSGQIHNSYLSTASVLSDTYYAYDTSYHVYGMRLDPSFVTFFQDGAQTYQAAYDGNAYAWHIIINAAVTTAATGTGFPATWNIDYVRTWTVTGVPAQPVITSVTPANGIPVAGSLQVAFSAVPGATSYRATSCPYDQARDGIPWPPPRATASGSASPLTVTGLTNGAQYTITVGASNATGWGIESLPVPALLPNVSTAPIYAVSQDIVAGGAGSWVNPGNADGTPDTTYATWTAP